MNPSLSVFLVNKATRCISVAYDKGVDARGNAVGRDVKSFKTFDQSIAKGNFVVVPTDTRWGYTVGRVEEVDLRVNYQSNEEMRWIVSRIDVEQFKDFCKQEKVLIDRVADAEEEKRRKELAQALQEINPDFSGLSIVDASASAKPKTDFEPPHRGGAQPPSAPAEPWPPVKPSPVDPEDLF